jgi:three-Cys-motif partner protein
MGKNRDFFAKRQGAAVLKHGLLKRYLPKFVGKTGKYAPDHRVVYIDGFAGTGAYDDGSPGSPLLAAQLAAGMAHHRTLECVYIEKKKAVVAKLKAALQPIEHKGEVLQGTAAEHVPSVLRRYGGVPLFAFLDPFGLKGLPFDLVVRLLRRTEMPGVVVDTPTEVLLNFSITALQRVGGYLRADGREPSASEKAALSNLDAALGGDWWRAIWAEGGADKGPAILREYVRRIREATGNGFVGWVVPVSDTSDGPPAYLLVFFTRSRDGIWEFNEALSLARDEHLAHCEGDEPARLIDLRDLELVGKLRVNLVRRLEDVPEFSVLDEFPAIFHGIGGDARTTHLRDVLKGLHKEGVIDHDGKGQLKDAVIRRARRG